ncbi:hypothetical protein OE88DRAFT_1739059 [Heliocybe sulcata]|uniref:Uncharacterized protein n=1 Tax=Heliocybe sulcata TaxID=5364 RepID=A0A5C3MNI7_9AGAM|nr:hypothetical protein OE88DRAFT_1739059 [Heliocybe sulcata]
MALSPEENYIICIIVESVLYAIYLLFFCTSIYLTCSRARSFAVLGRLAVLLVVLFIGTTTNFVIDVYSTKMFWTSPAYWADDTLRGNQEQNSSALWRCIHDGIFGLDIFLADALLVWRYYVFQDKKTSAAIFPLMLITLEISLGTAVIAHQAQKYLIRKNTPWDEPLPARFYQVAATSSTLDKAYYSCTFAINLVLNTAISWKIWRLLRAMNAGPERLPSRHYRILHIMLESGVIYSILIIVAMGVSAIPYNTLFGDLMIMIFNMSIGMVPPVIIALISLGKTAEYTTRETVITTMYFAPPVIAESTATGAPDGTVHISLEIIRTAEVVEEPGLDPNKGPDGQVSRMDNLDD